LATSLASARGDGQSAVSLSLSVYLDAINIFPRRVAVAERTPQELVAGAVRELTPLVT